MSKRKTHKAPSTKLRRMVDEIRRLKADAIKIEDELGRFKAGAIKMDRQRKIVSQWIDVMTRRFDEYEVDRDEYLSDYSLSPQSFGFFTDVILPFCTNTLIMDNIAAAEGFNYGNKPERNRLSIRFFYKRVDEGRFREVKAYYPSLTGYNQSRSIVYPDTFPYLLTTRANGDNLAQGLNDVQLRVAGRDGEVIADPFVSLPSPHTLYSILENVIRNSAKHNTAAKDAETIGFDCERSGKVPPIDLQIHLHLQDDPEASDRYILTISDNVSRKTRGGLASGDRKIPGIFERMLIDPQKDGSLRRENLGFFDMQVNAFLMRWRGTELKHITNSSNQNLKLVIRSESNVRFSSEQIQSGPKNSQASQRNFRFGYQMTLLKPRVVLWLGGDCPLSSKNMDGVSVASSLNEYREKLDQSNRTLPELASFDFIVYAEQFQMQQYQGKLVDRQDPELTFLPPRVIVLTDKAGPPRPNVSYVPLSHFAGVQSPQQLIEECWRAWLSRKKLNVNGYVYFSRKGLSDEPFKYLNDLGTNLSIESAGKTEYSTKEDLSDGANDLNVIYDNHDRAFDALSQNSRFNPPTEMNFYTKHTKINFDKSSDDFVLLNRLGLDNERDRILGFRLLDAATTNVFVLDERIAAIAARRVSGRNESIVGISDRRLEEYNLSRLCYAKIFVITRVDSRGRRNKVIANNPIGHDIHLVIDENNGVSIEAEPTTGIFAGLKDLSKDILVVHRTFINENKTGFAPKTLLHLLNQNFGSVVITSGGGYPFGEDIKQRFVPFSYINACVGNSLSKIKLVTQLQTLIYA